MLNVDIHGRLPAECAVKQVVLGRGGKILVAAYNVRNAHCVVVHNICKVIGGHTVGFQQHLVVKVCILNGDIAVNLVVECGCALGRDFLPDNALSARLLFRLCLLGRKVAAGAAVKRSSAAGLFLVRILGGFVAEAVVCVTGFYQLFCVLLEHSHALALNIRTVIASHIGTLVPVKPARTERVVNHINSALNISALVGILNTQNKGAVIFLCDKIGIKRRPEVSYMGANLVLTSAISVFLSIIIHIQARSACRRQSAPLALQGLQNAFRGG